MNVDARIWVVVFWVLFVVIVFCIDNLRKDDE
jgi:hypothetical protein